MFVTLSLLHPFILNLSQIERKWFKMMQEICYSFYFYVKISLIICLQTKTEIVISWQCFVQRNNKPQTYVLLVNFSKWYTQIIMIMCFAMFYDKGLELFWFFFCSLYAFDSSDQYKCRSVRFVSRPQSFEGAYKNEMHCRKWYVRTDHGCGIHSITANTIQVLEALPWLTAPRGFRLE